MAAVQTPTVPQPVPLKTMALERAQVTLLGDSITQYSMDRGGFGAALAHWYQRKADIRVRGYSGYNTRWALLLLKKQIELALWGQPDLVIVFFGANDAAFKHLSVQHIPVEQYAQYLRDIVQLLRKQGTKSGAPTRIILIAPPPVDEERWEQYSLKTYNVPKNRSNEEVIKYTAACAKVGDEEKVPVIKLYERMTEKKDWKEMLDDGLHLSEKGGQLVFELLQAVIREKYPRLNPESEQLLPDWPLYANIDHMHPERSFNISM